MTAEFLTLPEITRAAEQTLLPPIWDYVNGGAASETTLRRNRSALDRLHLRQRILRNVSTIDCRTTLLGHGLRIPVILAPIGALALVTPEGIVASAKAGGQFGTLPFVSVMGFPSLEVIAENAAGPLVFQLYVRGDRAWLADVVTRARESGYKALCLTVDTALYGRRHRDLERRFFPATAIDRPNVASTMGAEGDRYQAEADWDTLAYLKSISGLPVILKGVLDAEDARLAVQAGVSAVYVSNHGGRQLDHASATIDVLQEIVEAVDGRAEVIVDSGFKSGSDVVKALALGARAVGIGKLQACALAAGGVAGLVRALELLEIEITNTLGLIGVPSVAALKPDALRFAAPVYE